MIGRLLRPVCVASCAVHLQAPPTLLIHPHSICAPCHGKLQSQWRNRLQQITHSSDSATSRRSTANISNSGSPSDITCWKCGKEIPTMRGNEVSFFCPCDKRVILPPTVTNYFTILQCKPVRVDTEALKKRHTQLQRELHPDKFSNKSQMEKEYSALQSALVNEAFSTLSKPYSRGLYLMELNGVKISESDNYVASGDSGKHLTFLEEVMELRGEIHHLENSPTPDLALVKRLWNENNAQVQNYIREFEDCFERHDLDKAKEALSKLKYFVTNSEILHPLLPDD